jgi:hypothetical protein
MVSLLRCCAYQLAQVRELPCPCAHSPRAWPRGTRVSRAQRKMRAMTVVYTHEFIEQVGLVPGLKLALAPHLTATQAGQCVIPPLLSATGARESGRECGVPWEGTRPRTRRLAGRRRPRGLATAQSERGIPPAAGRALLTPLAAGYRRAPSFRGRSPPAAPPRTPRSCRRWRRRRPR